MKRGAFTGTTGTREGYFEKAGSGTLFLDEIGDLSLDAQVKLLRVLQERHFSRLGSNRLIRLQARIIFATHRDLVGMVKAGIFRGDLYYRINVMTITAPPLREHPKIYRRLPCTSQALFTGVQSSVKAIDPDAMTVLQTYTWPGNVREIENVIQRAIIMASGDTINRRSLPLQTIPNNVIGISEHHSANSFDRNLLSYKVTMAMAALKEYQGNKSLAARSLGISRPFFYRLIRLGEMHQPLDIGKRQSEAM